MLSIIININHTGGATYSQAFYVAKYLPLVLRLLEVNVLRREHLIYHNKTLRTLNIQGISKKIKALRFICGVVD